MSQIREISTSSKVVQSQDYLTCERYGRSDQGPENDCGEHAPEGLVEVRDWDPGLLIVARRGRREAEEGGDEAGRPEQVDNVEDEKPFHDAAKEMKICSRVKVCNVHNAMAFDIRKSQKKRQKLEKFKEDQKSFLELNF